MKMKNPPDGDQETHPQPLVITAEEGKGEFVIDAGGTRSVEFLQGKTQSLLWVWQGEREQAFVTTIAIQIRKTVGNTRIFASASVPKPLVEERFVWKIGRSKNFPGWGNTNSNT